VIEPNPESMPDTKRTRKPLFVESASFDRLSKDIRILPIVVAELELGNIERHVFGAHLVESAHHPALEDRPEALDRVRVNGAHNVLAFGVVNGRVRKILAKVLVTNQLIGAEQAYFVRYGFAHEGFKCTGFEVFDNAGDDIAFAADGADDGRLAGADAASPAALPALVPMRPPMKVSSTSTMPPSLSISMIMAALILWHMDQAVS
jgi:hypothetical protein